MCTKSISRQVLISTLGWPSIDARWTLNQHLGWQSVVVTVSCGYWLLASNGNVIRSVSPSVCLAESVCLSGWLTDRPTDQRNSRFHSAFDCMQLHQCIIAYHPDYYFQCYINCYMCVYVFRVLRICILCGLLLFKWLPLCTCCGFSWVSPVLCLWHLWFSWYFTSHDLEEFLLC